ncbi:Protein of unknown function [Propionibacterium freudenreichii]|nr:Protein of unknown function [Propionibacterium freudenreichii]
MLLRRLDIAKA